MRTGIVRWLCYAALATALLGSVTGCSSAAGNDYGFDGDADGDTIEPYGQLPAKPTDKRSRSSKHGWRPLSQPIGRVNSSQLATIAEHVSGVHHADVLMYSNDVVVGIHSDNPVNNKLLEQKVYSALKWQYAEYNYYVTADSELRMRIKEATDKHVGMAAGDSALMNDISWLIQQIDGRMSRTDRRVK
ncbi:YhcN/YlaJ family sporulation lipoprotein [Paenibacillus sp. J5C_2022]|uniref:YhcN/YlaJ family sporulation lipoprotein n=1 Tax=Paenibacillus sp. J5C2022 TaxID=2977129 RepID=UPI0021D182C7|nr:YhcN/YlaJ family sporulation lipoprotein [Paenibacillus sp. J5C2022]MCU6709886.1 YhcN/YlaJ family sporulation lipoprotein [Paenibacillus sp. J5C2022]